MTRYTRKSLAFLIVPIILASFFASEAVALDTAHVSQYYVAAPSHISIPAVDLSATIIPVGLTKGGAMDVPSGKSNNVGWYDKGVKPGMQGNAVLDAHVFAAFSKLSQVQVGDAISIQSGSHTLHYVVDSVSEYLLATLTSAQVFGAHGGSTITLITCAGTFVPAQNTYDHRLVVVARLVS